MSFLDKIQSADESRKRKWMIVITAVIMIAVIYVWLAYFNNLVSSVSEPSLVASREEDRSFSFFETMRSGAAAIFDSFKDFIGGEREYIITPLE